MSGDQEKGKYTTPEGSKTWEYASIFICSTIGLSVGSIMGWNSPSIVKLMEPDSPVPVTPSNVSTLAALVAIGHMVAPPLNTMIVDRIGRKNTILVSTLPLIISWFMIMLAESVLVLYIARFLAGLCLGLGICVTPMYIGEVSSANTRGAAGTIMGIMYNTGILFTFIVAPYLTIHGMAGVLLALVLSTALAFLVVPESPYFLAMKGRTEEAEAVLEKLRGKTDVSEEMEIIIAALSDKEKSEKRTGSIKDVFTVRGNRRAFIVICLFSLTHHFGGFIAILTFSQLIFKNTDSIISDHMATVLIGVMQIVSTVMTGFLVDRLGRKPLVLASGFIAGLCNLVIGVFFYLKEYRDIDVSAYSLAPFIATLVLIFAFNCGFLSLQMILMSEMFATEVKAISTCLVSIAGGVFGTAGMKLYILMSITLNYGHSVPFLVFFAVMWICTVVILSMMPETKGKSFVEIQKDLNAKK